MSRVEVLEAAGVGHRITHEDDLPPPRGVAAVATLTRSVMPRQSGVLSAVSVGRGITVMSLGEVDGEDPGEAPDPSGAIEQGSPDTFMGAAMRPLATADEDMVVPCENDSDGPILTGAATVFVNGKPIARRSEELDCGAVIGEGEPTVLVGGPSTESTQRTGEGLLKRRTPGFVVGQVLGERSSLLAAAYSRSIAGGDGLQTMPSTTEMNPATQVGRMMTQRDNTSILRLVATGQ